jgi:glycosyltransferase involved in cell wall biosynthesis
MRTLVVTHYFPPEIGAPQARLSELARAWAEPDGDGGGDEVTVLTGMPNHPTGVVHPDYRRRLRARETVDGYRVVRTWLYATPNEGLVRKTLGHLSFMVSSVVLGGRAAGPADVVVVSSPTFFSIFSAWLLARLKRARLVIDVRDLWPAIFVELGVLTNRAVIGLLERLELWAYGQADGVVVVSEGFRRDLLRRGVPEAKVHTIPNGVDLDRFRPRPADPEIRRRLGAVLDGDLLVLYVGAHGISHGLGAVLDAAAKLDGDPARPVHVALVGEGAQKRALAERLAELGVANVTMAPAVPRDEMPALLAAADVCLVSLRDVPLFSSFIPSKMFEYLGAGRAVVGAVAGEAAEILRAGGAAVVGPEDAGALAGVLRELAADPGRRRRMGEQARSYVERAYDRRALAARYRAVLRGVCR